MLCNPAVEVVCNACVKCSITLAGKDVNVKHFHSDKKQELDAVVKGFHFCVKDWIPGQARDDTEPCFGEREYTGSRERHPNASFPSFDGTPPPEMTGVPLLLLWIPGQARMHCLSAPTELER